MKIKTPYQIVDSTRKVPQDVLNHVQNMTDDLRGILLGGLSFSDKQLPFQYREVTVTTGQPTILYIQAPYTTIGAIPVQTYGVNIISWNVNMLNSKLSITVNFEGTTAKIGFLMIGASI
jgi:hypothetical protein